MNKAYKFIFKYLRPHWIKLLIVAFCCMVSMVIALFYPIIIQQITDEGLIGKNYSKIVQFTGVLLICMVLGELNQLLQNWLMISTKNDIAHLMHVQAFDKLLHLKLEYFTTQNSAEIITKINSDIEYVCLLLDRGFLSMVGYCLQIISGLIGLFWINWKLAICILVCLPIKWLVLRITSTMSERVTEKSIDLKSKVSAWMSDRILGIREIKIFNRYKMDTLKYSNLRRQILDLDKKQEMIRTADSISEELIQAFLTAIAYFLGGFFVCSGQLSVGSVLAFISYSGSVMGPISSLMNIRMIIAQIRPSYKRLMKFFDLQVEHSGYINFHEQLLCLEMKSIQFGYDKKNLICDANLCIKRGEKVALIGENGSGKTTLLNLILKFYLPDRGIILVNQINSNDIYLPDYRKVFSVVSQTIYLFQETVRDNLNYEGKYSDTEIINTFSKLGQKKLFDNLPKGLDTIIDVGGANLSGGEKQKLALVRAYLCDAPILILDEGTSNFDFESEEWVYTEGLSFFKNKIVLAVIHRKQFLQYFDKVYRLADGKLIEEIKTGL